MTPEEEKELMAYRETLPCREMRCYQSSIHQLGECEGIKGHEGLHFYKAVNGQFIHWQSRG